MSGGPPIKIVSGFAPYGDGSGYAVSVVIQQEYEGGPTMISIETVHHVDASKWPEIRNRIDRLLEAMPTPATGDVVLSKCPVCGWEGGGIRDEGCIVAFCPRHHKGEA